MSTTNQNPDRIIIGENFMSGLPISAPMQEADATWRLKPKIPMRWRKHENYFTLETWNSGEWVEVPCVIAPDERPTKL